MKKLIPLDDRVLITRDEAPDKTPGGILLPQNAVEKPKRGRVVAVGEGVLKQDGTRLPIDLEPGDTVLFGAYAGSEIEHDGEKFTVLNRADILAKIS